LDLAAEFEVASLFGRLVGEIGFVMKLSALMIGSNAMGTTRGRRPTSVSAVTMVNFIKHVMGPSSKYCEYKS
jgi:ABC-type tungstate transport system substrate-binding protein